MEEILNIEQGFPNVEVELDAGCVEVGFESWVWKKKDRLKFDI